MRDNAKGGALTEVTFFILLSLYTPKHGYAVMQFIEDSTKGRLTLGEMCIRDRVDTTPMVTMESLYDYYQDSEAMYQRTNLVIWGLCGFITVSYTHLGKAAAAL